MARVRLLCLAAVIGMAGCEAVPTVRFDVRESRDAAPTAFEPGPIADDGRALSGAPIAGAIVLFPIGRGPVDLAELAREIAEVYNSELPRDRQVSFFAPDTLSANADLSLMRSVLQNLLGNAWKFTSRRDVPRVELGLRAAPGVPPAYFVRDNGAGFDQAYASKLFRVFQRLHSEDDFPGTGVGLASVHRIISKHGGRIWAESQPGNGATFFFTLGEAAAAPTS